MVNPFDPGNFAKKKRVLKPVEQFSGHCLAIKNSNVPQNCYRLYAPRPSDHKILACEVQECTEGKISS